MHSTPPIRINQPYKNLLQKIFYIAQIALSRGEGTRFEK